MTILTNKATLEVRIIGEYGTTLYFKTREDAIRDYKRLKRNYYAREKNQMLSDLTGTSAAAARKDMGI